MPRLNGETLMAAGVLSVAGASLVGSLQLAYYTEFGPDAGFFPYWVSLGLCIVGSVLLYDAAINAPEPQTTSVFTLRQGSALAGFAAYIAGLALIGFAAATALLLFLVVAFAERRKYWVATVYSAATTISFVWLFDEMFRLQLPRGMIW
jgi:hypothetical protein